MDAVSVTEGRLRALFRAGLSVTSELSLDAVLRRLVEAAAELTGAQYAALGVIDANGAELEQFITQGIDDELRRGDRRAAARARHPRRADPRREAVAAARPHRGSAVGRGPTRTPADAELPRRADHAARRRVREPLPHREGRRRRLHDEDEELVDAPRRPGGRGDRERAPLRGGDALVAPARVAERGRERARDGDRSRAAARPRRRRLRELLDARVVALVLPVGSDELRFAAVGRRGAESCSARRSPRAGSKSGRCSSAGAASASTRCSTIPRSPGGHAAARRPDRHVGAADRPRPRRSA